MKDIKKEMKAAEAGNEPTLSRKDAMKKLGLSAFSAATMMILLNNPARGQDESPPLPPEW